MAVTPSASYSLTIRVEIRNRRGMLGKVTSATGEAGGDIGAVDIVELRNDATPSVFNKKVAPAVARAVVKAAHKAGVARRTRRPASH